MAGIGNIYSDEILFQAGIHPGRHTDELKEEQKTVLYHSVKEVLAKTIEAGANPAKFPNHYLIPHRNEGDECPVCSGKVEKIKISGRGCFVCPNCQK